MPEYLRQLKSGHIYIWTAALAARKDMLPLDPDKAETRIAALQNKIQAQRDRITALTAEGGRVRMNEEAAKAKELAQRLTELETESAALDQQEAKLVDESLTPNMESSDIKPAEPQTEEEVLAKNRQEKIDSDREVQDIRAMRTKNQVKEYMLREYGEELDDKMLLPQLKAFAEATRVKRMEEEG